ncbi:hypothetical protein [Nocardioides sp.]|uniref:hypothetical protein n=1 Tax=Nocardioides sp. TaxID=35761 RepID=UPI00351720AF
MGVLSRRRLAGAASVPPHVVGSAVRRGRRLLVDLVVARPPHPGAEASESGDPLGPLEVVVRVAGAAAADPEHPRAAGWTPAERVECEGDDDARVLVFRFTAQGTLPPAASRPLVFEADLSPTDGLTLEVDVPAPTAVPLVLAVG